jgi:hypothetical protein
MRLIAFVVATVLFGQTPPTQPDLNGNWTLNPAKSGSPAQNIPITDMRLTIQQTSDEIRMESQVASDKPIIVVYPIMPAPKPPAEPLSGNARRAYWDGNRLVLERGTTISGQTVSLKESLTLSPDRSELTLERLVIVQHGYTLKGAKNYASVKDVFTRAAP